MSETPRQSAAPKFHEGWLLFFVAAVQFVNILDFMMVMPLGPDFAKSLEIDMAHLGYIGGSYTLSAFVSGIVWAGTLDRFDRRTALCGAMLGLVIATALGGLATGLPTLLAARVLAGWFGGPATSIALSIVADAIPPERRGKAMGAVMGAFSAASVLGVPAGLELAKLSDWRAPFFGVATLGLAVVLLAFWRLPSLTLHLVDGKPVHRRLPVLELLQRPRVRLSLGCAVCIFMSIFLIIPNIATYLQFNLGFPRDDLGKLYLIGGFFTFFSMRLAGLLVDRVGSTLVVTCGSLIMGGLILWMFAFPTPGMPVLLVFILFMVFGTSRGVALNTLVSKVPQPHERAGFMSLQSATQHLASAAGAFLSSQILSEGAAKRLIGMDRLAFLTIAIAAGGPFMMNLLERHIRRHPHPAAQYVKA